MSWRKWWWSVPLLLVCAGIGAVLYIRSLPVNTPGDVEAAAGMVEELTPAPSDACRQPPVLGDAIEGAIDVQELLVEGPFTECLDAVREEGALRDWLDVPENLVDPWFVRDGDDSEIPLYTNVPIQRGLETSALEKRLAAQCAGLETLVERAARTTRTCSVTHPDAPLGETLAEDDRVFSRIIALGLAAAVLAREHVRDGRAADALRLLVRTLAVARRLRDGPGSLVGSMLVIALERRVVLTLHSLLFYDLEVAPSTLDELVGAMDDVLEIDLEVRDSFSSEGRVISRDAIGTEEEQGASVVAISIGLKAFLDACPEGATPEACNAALPAMQRYTPGRLVDVFGRRVERTAINEGLAAIWVGEVPTYLGRLEEAQMGLLFARGLIGLARQRAAGECDWRPELESVRAHRSSMSGADLGRFRWIGYPTNPLVSECAVLFACEGIPVPAPDESLPTPAESEPGAR